MNLPCMSSFEHFLIHPHLFFSCDLQCPVLIIQIIGQITNHLSWYFGLYNKCFYSNNLPVCLSNNAFTIWYHTASENCHAARLHSFILCLALITISSSLIAIACHFSSTCVTMLSHLPLIVLTKLLIGAGICVAGVSLALFWTVYICIDSTIIHGVSSCVFSFSASISTLGLVSYITISRPLHQTSPLDADCTSATSTVLTFGRMSKSFMLICVSMFIVPNTFDLPSIACNMFQIALTIALADITMD